MTPTPSDPFPGSGLPALDLAFLHRVYRTSGIVVVLLALMVWGRWGRAAGLGLACGSGLSLLALAGLEWSVTRFIRPEQQSAPRLLGSVMLQMLGLMLLLALIALLAWRRWVAILWVLPGFALPHAVIVLKLVGQKLRQATEDSIHNRS